jgi:hypothetical protein
MKAQRLEGRMAFTASRYRSNDVGEFFHPTPDNSGMNYQQRYRALSE